MTELLDIIKAYNNARVPVALATMVKTTGSTCRHAGARMLIISETESVGCISPGGVDRDVIRHAVAVRKNRISQVLNYDAATQQDLIMDEGTGGNDSIQILVEYLPPASSPAAVNSGILNFLEGRIKGGLTCAIATVVTAREGMGLRAVDRAMVDGANEIIANAGSLRVAGMLVKWAERAWESGRSEMVYHTMENDTAEIFVEVFRPQNHLVVLGAGQDAGCSPARVVVSFAVPL
jgi:xanthine/CO dehydrogenase XdhC/CoxF family maturation factor